MLTTEFITVNIERLLFQIKEAPVVFLVNEVAKITLGTPHTPQENQSVPTLFRRHNHDYFFFISGRTAI